MYKSKLLEFGDSIAEYPWDNREFYGLFIGQTYMYVRHTLKLLALTASHFDASDTPMINRFVKHCAEEKGHDGLLSLDLKGLGIDPKSVVEMHPTSAFYQLQYYKVQHVSPYAIFGWILMLEGLAALCGEAIYQKCDKAHGARSTHFLRVHVKEDPEHFSKALEMIATLPPVERAHIELGFKEALFFYDQILGQCKAQMRMAKGSLKLAA